MANQVETYRLENSRAGKQKGGPKTDPDRACNRHAAEAEWPREPGRGQIMFGIKRLETQIADQAKTIAELSGGLFTARGEIAALYMMARVLLAAIEELSGADREEIITVLKEAIGRGSGWITPGASADDERIFNDAYSRVLQAFIKDSEGPPPPEP
jgi:uncharacterized coiled-coil protein SlyX